MTSFRCNQKDLAKVLRLTDRRVRDLVKTGVLPGTTAAGYDLMTAVPAYIDFLRRDAGDLKAERTRVAKLKADLLALDYDVRRKELVPWSEIEPALFKSSRTCRDQLLNIPSRLAGVCAAATDQDKVFELIDREVRQTLEALVHEFEGQRPRSR